MTLQNLQVLHCRGKLEQCFGIARQRYGGEHRGPAHAVVAFGGFIFDRAFDLFAALDGGHQIIHQQVRKNCRLANVAPVTANHPRAFLRCLFDDFGVEFAVRALVVANFSANQLAANLFSHLVRKVSRPSKGFGFLSDGGVAHAVALSDGSDGKRTGPVGSFDRLPVGLLGCHKWSK